MKPLLKPALAPYVLISPFLLLFLVFGLFPIVFSFILMFHIWDPVQGLDSMKYVGLENISFAIVIKICSCYTATIIEISIIENIELLGIDYFILKINASILHFLHQRS